MSYDLNELYAAGELACAAAIANRQAIGGAVNWARLWCSDAERCESYDGTIRYRLEFTKADASAVELQQWLREDLARRGFPGVVVGTEW